MDTPSEVLPLSQLVRIVLTRTLADGPNDSSCQTVLAQLSTEAYTAVSEKILKDFIRDYPRYVTNESLLALVPRHLRHLSINNCFRITPLGLHQLLAFNRCPRIESLTLSGCDQLMHDQIFQLVCETSVHLSSVTLEGCGGVTDECVKTLLKGLPSLQELNLALCTGITDQVFLLDAAGQFIRMEAGFNDSKLTFKLCSIDLSGCSQLSSTCIRHLTTLCGPVLRKVNLESTRMDCTALWYLSGYGLNSALQMALGTDSSFELPQSKSPVPEIEDPAVKCRENLDILIEEYETALHEWKASANAGNLDHLSSDKDVDAVDSGEPLGAGCSRKKTAEGVALQIADQVETGRSEIRETVWPDGYISEESTDPCGNQEVKSNTAPGQQSKKAGKSGVMGKMFGWVQNLFNKSSTDKSPVEESVSEGSGGATSEAVEIPGKKKSLRVAWSDENQSGDGDGSSQLGSGGGTYETACSPADSLNLQDLRFDSIGSCCDSLQADSLQGPMIEIDGYEEEPDSYQSIPYIDSLDPRDYKSDAVSYLSYADSLDGNPRKMQPLFSVDGASIYSFQVDSLENPSRFPLQRPISYDTTSMQADSLDCQPRYIHMARPLSIESNNFQVDSLECHSHKLMRPLSIHSYQVDSLDNFDMSSPSATNIEGNFPRKKNRPVSIISYDLDSLENFDLNMDCPVDVEMTVQRRKQRPVSIHSYQIDSLENFSMGVGSPIDMYNKECYGKHFSPKTPETVCGSYYIDGLDIGVLRYYKRNSTCSEYLDSLECDFRRLVCSHDEVGNYTCCDTPRNDENLVSRCVIDSCVKPLDTLQECDTSMDSSMESACLMPNMNSADAQKRDVMLSSSGSSTTPTSHDARILTLEGAADAGSSAGNRQSMVCDSLESPKEDNTTSDSSTAHRQCIVCDSLEDQTQTTNDATNSASPVVDCQSIACDSLEKPKADGNTNAGSSTAHRQSIVCDSLEDQATDNDRDLTSSHNVKDSLASIEVVGACASPDTNDLAINPSETVDIQDSKSSLEECHLGACASQNTSSVDNELETFIKQIYKSNIVSLDITDMNFHNYEMGLACLRAFFAANRDIQSFAITWEDLKDEALHFIAELATELKSLSLVGCDRLTSFGISNLTSQCTKLRNLNLQGVNFISDPALLPLVLRGQVTALNLAETNVTDRLLKKIATCCKDQLQCLDLSWCEELTLEGLNSLAKGGDSLERLSLRQSVATDVTISLLVENCRQLSHVNLSHINLSSLQNLTDDAIIAMAECMPGLVDVDISWNSDLSDFGVSSMLRRCIHLENFVVSGIKLLTTKPFLPIIGDIASWRRSKAVLLFRLQERQAHPDDDDVLTSDEEDDDIQLPHRSSSYATSLRHLHLEYCDRLDDTVMEEIVAVCRGTLTVRDYYGDNVLPRYIIDNKAQKYYPPLS